MLSESAIQLLRAKWEGEAQRAAAAQSYETWQFYCVMVSAADFILEDIPDSFKRIPFPHPQHQEPPWKPSLK